VGKWPFATHAALFRSRDSIHGMHFARRKNRREKQRLREAWEMRGFAAIGGSSMIFSGPLAASVLF
jgi:hypothetical protein